ncbi:hypothetical protein Agabi119p4_2637 [Agaricus bisporus var. burnettii]|uniref:T-cell immunomodulatory protein TIP C2 domain-containing protein n=1 Tax=Agaricus bisporus var. burnettii TaxID=192524 RepID=A0A8H7F9E4_AGABI|nr:hypothetical protein Agabi119p4_2637 [Agaricus bisporus var. burnettii]
MGQETNSKEIDMYLYQSIPNKGFDTANPIHVQTSISSQPIPLDVNGDLRIDLLGLTPDGGSKLQVWKNVWNSSRTDSPLFDVQSSYFNDSHCQIANPHSNAVVDLNGDCLADVFLVCDEGRGQKSFQIWLNKKSQSFVLAMQGSLPSGTQSISFADIDRDGPMDMIFTTCKVVSSSGVGSDCYINIAYNQQLRFMFLHDRLWHEEWCTNSPDNNAFVRFPVSSLFRDGHKQSLLVWDTSFDPPIPLSLRLGDANLDGFPDFLAIFASGNDRTPYLPYSKHCASGVAGCDSKVRGGRGWEVATNSGMKALANGTLDILVQRTGLQDGSKVLFIQNNFYYDAFFLKAIALNGACDSGWCYSANGSERYHPFGVRYSGATYKYTVFDTLGHRSAAESKFVFVTSYPLLPLTHVEPIVGQLPQTSYHALQTPYSFFGLGRTNNYIENMFVGTTLHAPEHYINMEGSVIPNSRVVILPPADGGESGGTWKRELFLRSGDWIPWVTVTCVIGMVILAIIVFVLHLNEKREDELERRRISHHINFDAL